MIMTIGLILLSAIVCALVVIYRYRYLNFQKGSYKRPFVMKFLDFSRALDRQLIVPQEKDVYYLTQCSLGDIDYLLTKHQDILSYLDNDVDLIFVQADSLGRQCLVKFIVHKK